MAVKVLVVDDSGFFRRRVSEILSADPSIQAVSYTHLTLPTTERV